MLVLLKIIAEILLIFLGALTRTLVDILHIFLRLLQRFVTDLWMSILLIAIALIKGLFAAIFGVIRRVYLAVSPPVYEGISEVVHRRPRMAMAASLFVLMSLITALCMFYIYYFI